MEKNLKVTTKKKLRKVQIDPVAEQHGQDYRNELIRLTAYALFDARNKEHGYAECDWLEAEARVNQIMANIPSST